VLEVRDLVRSNVFRVCYKNTLVTEDGIPNPAECLVP